MTEKDGLPEGAVIGHTYTTGKIDLTHVILCILTRPTIVLINSPVYLKWLQKQFIQLGGKVIKQAISHIDDVFNFIQDQNPSHAAVINCTGLGARFLGGVQDDALYPTRGQTVIVHAPHIKRTITFVRPNGNTYIIPRSDGTVILGGTYNMHDL